MTRNFRIGEDVGGGAPQKPRRRLTREVAAGPAGAMAGRFGERDF